MSWRLPSCKAGEPLKILIVQRPRRESWSPLRSRRCANRLRTTNCDTLLVEDAVEGHPLLLQAVRFHACLPTLSVLYVPARAEFPRRRQRNKRQARIGVVVWTTNRPCRAKQQNATLRSKSMADNGRVTYLRFCDVAGEPLLLLLPLLLLRTGEGSMAHRPDPASPPRTWQCKPQDNRPMIAQCDLCGIFSEDDGCRLV